MLYEVITEILDLDGRVVGNFLHDHGAFTRDDFAHGARGDLALELVGDDRRHARDGAPLVAAGRGIKGLRIDDSPLDERVDDNIFLFRITSYNVCYTKLLRAAAAVALGNKWAMALA